MNSNAYPCECCTAKKHLSLKSFLAEAIAVYLPPAIFSVLLRQDRWCHTAVLSQTTWKMELIAFYFMYDQMTTAIVLYFQKNFWRRATVTIAGYTASLR